MRSNPFFRSHGRPALRRRFQERLTATSDFISTFEFFSINWSVTKIYYDRCKYMYINTVSANYATDCAQHSSFYLRLDLQLLKTTLCKNLGVKKLLDFAGKCPWLQARRQQLPALKSYLELWSLSTQYTKAVCFDNLKLGSALVPGSGAIGKDVIFTCHSLQIRTPL